MNKPRNNFYHSQVILIHCLLVGLKVVWVSVWSLELHYEEAQYWLWSKHLDWSYYSKPGMVAWMNFISTNVLGDTELGVKFPAIIAGLVTSIAIYYSAFYLYNNRKIAFLSSVMLYLMPFYYSISLFHSTDSFLVAFGAVSFYYFIKCIQEDRTKDWILLGLFLGLATLTKYSGLLIAVSYLLYLLFYKKNLVSRMLISAFIILLSMFPILIWNIQNDFASLKHVTKLASKTQEYNISRLLNGLLEYVGGQLAIVSPFLILLLIKSKINWDKALRLTVFPALVSFGIYFIILINKGQAPNVNWAFFNYAPLAIFFTVVLLNAKRIKWLVPVGVFMAFCFWIISNTSTLDQFGLGNIIKPKSDPTNLYHQWKQPAQSIAQNSQLKGKLIFSNNYKLASTFDFYMKGSNHIIYQGSGDRRNQLSYWNEIDRLDTKDKQVYFISSRPEFPAELENQYQEINLIEELPAHWRGADIKTYYLFEATAQEKLFSVVDGY